jgi:hypothetical protein
VSGLEEASPILWAKEEEHEPIKDSIALPTVFPTKVHIHFGEPMRTGLTPADLNDREALRAVSDKFRNEVLKMLRNYRPKAYAEPSI